MTNFIKYRLIMFILAIIIDKIWYQQKTANKSQILQGKIYFM